MRSGRRGRARTSGAPAAALVAGLVVAARPASAGPAEVGGAARAASAPGEDVARAASAPGKDAARAASAPGGAGGPGAALAEGVDWEAGLLVARAVGVADRHAPSPEAARGPARRRAVEAARARLAARAPGVPLAAGGTVAAALARDAAAAARLDAALGHALVLRAEPETDGAWTVWLALPLEAIRQALDGPRRLPPAGDAGPAVIVVEGAPGAPRLGVRFVGPGAPPAGVAGAVRWARARPAFAAGAPVVRGRATPDGAIAVDDLAGATSATLWVVRAPR